MGAFHLHNLSQIPVVCLRYSRLNGGWGGGGVPADHRDGCNADENLAAPIRQAKPSAGTAPNNMSGKGTNEMHAWHECIAATGKHNMYCLPVIKFKFERDPRAQSAC